MIPIVPMGERILLKKINFEITVDEFYIDTEESTMLSNRAEVIAVGGQVDLDKFLLESGDIVFHSKDRPDIFKWSNEEYFFVVPKEITAKTEKDRVNELIS